jgi:multidrug efflux pump subunit AcrA (membrane-fusion protein)
MKISFQKQDKDPTVVHGMKVAYAPAKRAAAQWRWYVVLLCVSSPLIYFLIKLLLAWLIVSAQGFVSLVRIDVNSNASGIVERLHVRTGQQVTAGQTLAQLRNADLEAQMALRRAEYTALHPAGEAADTPQLRLARQRARLAGENLTTSRAFLKDVGFLRNQGAATVADLNLARERCNRAQMEYDQAHYELERLQAPGRPGATDADTGAARMRLQAQMTALTDEQNRLTQTAPMAGRVLDLFVVEGAFISPGTPMLLLGSADKPHIVAYLPTQHARYARQGRQATVRLADGTTLAAVVSQDAILTKRLPADLSSPIGSRDIMLLVELDLAAPLPAIQWVDGLPVSVRFAFRWF